MRYGDSVSLSRIRNPRQTTVLLLGKVPFVALNSSEEHQSLKVKLATKIKSFLNLCSWLEGIFYYWCNHSWFYIFSYFNQQEIYILILFDIPKHLDSM